MNRLPISPAALLLMAIAAVLLVATLLPGKDALLQPALALAGIAIAAGVLLLPWKSLSPLIPHPSSLSILPARLRQALPGAQRRPQAPKRASRIPRAAAILALLLVSITTLPSAQALWSKNLVVSGEVQMGEGCVRDLLGTFAEVADSTNDESTFSFVLDIQNIDDPACKDVSFVIGSVCFDAQLTPEGDVLWTAEPPGWAYDSQGGGALKWEWDLGGDGPAEGPNEFTFAVAGVLTTTTAELYWKGGNTAGDPTLVGEIIVPDCPLAPGQASTTSTSPEGPQSLLTTTAESAPPPVVVDPVPLYLGQSCNAFTPNGAAWTQFTIDVSGGLVDGVHELHPAFAVGLSNASGTAFDWAATLAVEAVAVQTLSGAGNLYVYDPPALAGAGLASPNEDITAVTFCVDTAALDAGTGGTEGDGATGDGSTPPPDPEPELDAPDKTPQQPDPNPGPFFSIDPGQQ